MTNEEKDQTIEEIYSSAKEKLLELEKKQQAVIAQYIHELEQKKIEALKLDINNSF